MPETRGLEVEYFLLVLGGWAGDPDDARKRGLEVECFLLVMGGWAEDPDDARNTGFGSGILFASGGRLGRGSGRCPKNGVWKWNTVCLCWVAGQGIRTMPEKRGLAVGCFLLVSGGWAGDPDDARTTGFGSGIFVACVGWLGRGS